MSQSSIRIGLEVILQIIRKEPLASSRSHRVNLASISYSIMKLLRIRTLTTTSPLASSAAQRVTYIQTWPPAASMEISSTMAVWNKLRTIDREPPTFPSTIRLALISRICLRLNVTYLRIIKGNRENHTRKTMKFWCKRHRITSEFWPKSTMMALIQLKRIYLATPTKLILRSTTASLCNRLIRARQNSKLRQSLNLNQSSSQTRNKRSYWERCWHRVWTKICWCQRMTSRWVEHSKVTRQIR